MASREAQSAVESSSCINQKKPRRADFGAFLKLIPFHLFHAVGLSLSACNLPYPILRSCALCFDPSRGSLPLLRVRISSAANTDEGLLRCSPTFVLEACPLASGTRPRQPSIEERLVGL